MVRTVMICTVLALAGCATTQTPSTAQNTEKPSCPTASRLPRADCVAGQSISQKDLNSTGQQNNNLNTSLKMLDPAVH